MKRSVKIGTYSFVMGVIVLAALIVANLLVGALPSGIADIDVSGTGLTEISDETAKFVSGMTEDVTIYWLCENGVEDEQFRLLLSRYEEAGKHVTVKVVDPLKDTAFTSKYSVSSVSPFSVIVESGRRSTVVDMADYYAYTNSVFQVVYQQFPQYFPADILKPMSRAELDSFTAQNGTIISYMLMQMGLNVPDITQYETVHSFVGESKITAALDYVTQEYIPHAYLLAGHGDSKPSKTLNDLMNSMDLNVTELDLATSGGIPADAGVLILFAPKTDLSAHEAALVTEYLNAGGSLMLHTAPDVMASCPNLQGVVALFGLKAEAGLVQEGDTGYIANNSQYTLKPTPNTAHNAMAYVSSTGYTFQMPNAHAITAAETLPAGVTVTPLLTTSDKAVRVASDKSATLSEPGKMNVAVAATKSITANGASVTASLTWYASSDAITDVAAEGSSGGNYYYYAATLSLMSPRFVSSYNGLSGVSMMTTPLNVDGTALLLVGIVSVLVIPVGLLTVGIVIWFRRKRR
jgi:ABC-2 type transport system permease protein